MNEPENQHFVPKFYLKNWCSEADNKLQAYRWLPNGTLESRRRGPTEVCSQRDLYSLRTVHKEFKYLVENVFQELESKTAPIAQELLRGIIPTTSNERSIWTCYLLAQRIRVKNELKEYLARCRPVIEGRSEQIQSEYDISKASPNTPKSIIDVLLENIPELDKNVTMLSMINFLFDGGPNQDILINMKWYVADTSRYTHKLLTSDQPIIYTAGLKEPTAEIIFPISPTKIFIACNGSDLKKPSEMVRFCNEQIARLAQNVVIAYDDTQRLFIERRLARPN